MTWQDRITIDPTVLVGKPVIKGTRLAVEFIVDLLAHGWTEAEILRNYLGITPEDIRACLAYASALLHAEKVYPLGDPAFRDDAIAASVGVEQQASEGFRNKLAGKNDKPKDSEPEKPLLPKVRNMNDYKVTRKPADQEKQKSKRSSLLTRT